MNNQVPKTAAIISSIIIPITFVLFVDHIKKKAAKKIIGTKSKSTDYQKTIEYELKFKRSYREKELQYFLPFSLIYLLALLLIVYLIGPYINFNMFSYYFSPEGNKPLSEKIYKTILVQVINLILYSGLLIQFILKIEALYEKTAFSYFMENIYGPILEEVIYRGLLFSLLKCAGYNGVMSAVYSSLLFSLSHFRHVFDLYFTMNQIPHLFFQSFYTLFFGFYTCYAYNYSGTIISAIILHGVCNTLQIPRFFYLHNEEVSPNKKKIISVTYIVGIIAWVILIYKFH